MGRISIGLDIGHRHVRAVALAPARAAEAREGARARVVATACVDRLDSDGHAKPLIATLAEIETLLGKRGSATAHLGDLGTLVRLVPTMALPPDKRQRLLRLELIQHADESGDLAADAWQVPLPGEDIIHGCVIGQPAQIIAALAEIRAARLPSPSISYAPAAMANAIAPGQLTGDELALVIDIGSATTGLTLVGDGSLLACRQVPMGGEAFTDALMASGLDRRAAERRKIDGEPPAPSEPLSTTAVSAVGLDAVGEAPVLPRVSDSSFDALFEDDAPAPAKADAPPSEAPESLLLVLDDGEDEQPPIAPAPAPIAASAPLPLPGEATTNLGRVALGPELQRTAEAFYAQLAASVLWFKTQLHLERLTISKVWLVGGGAALPGLDTYLQRRFNAPVARLDPFERLATANARRPADGPAWSAAIGLALSDPALGGRDAIRLDVRPESLVRADFRRRHQVWPYVAAACLALASACAGIVLWRESAARQASIEAYAQWKASHTDLTKKLIALDADKDALSEDLRAIAGRIYAGRDLLFAVRALKEQALQSKELWVTRLETQGVGGAGTDGNAPQPPQPAAKAYDSAIDRGALLLSGRVKFSADKTDTGRDQFLKAWREALVAWKPTPDAPTLFLKQRMVLWDPNHRPTAKPGAKEATDEGEFPFQVEFAFRPTQLDQITALLPEKSDDGDKR